MTDWAASGREDTYRCTLVDPFTLQDLREVEIDADACDFSRGYYTDNKTQATVVLAAGADYRTSDVDRMVRVRQRTRIGDYDEERVLFTCFVKDAEFSEDEGEVARTLACYGPLLRYTEDCLVDDFQRCAGDNVVQSIRDLVEERGGMLSVSPDVDQSQVHTITYTPFEMGTAVSEAMNTIAGWIDCEIGDTPWGEVRLGPYQLPRDKGSRYTFEDGGNCVCLPGLTRTDNRGDRCNRAVMYYSRDSKQSDPSQDGYDPYPLFARADAQLAETSPFSWARCGRWRSYVEKVSEACSQESLQAKADRYVEENSQGIEYIEVSAANVPAVDVGCCVDFIRDGARERCLVTQMEASGLAPGLPTKYKMKVVG